ncbi:MAG: antibiotic biosynthesis monooxygenase family protein, partial [Nitrospinota bacterium]
MEGRTEQEAVFMINVIAVPDTQAGEFLKRWDRITEYMRRQPGFVRTDLYRRFDDPVRWVNIAAFESIKAIRVAFSTEEFDRLAKDHPGYRDVG